MKKLTLTGLSSLALVSSTFAAVTMDEAGKLTGELDLAPFYSVAGVVVVAIAAIWGIKKAFTLIRA